TILSYLFPVQKIGLCQYIETYDLNFILSAAKNIKKVPVLKEDYIDSYNSKEVITDKNFVICLLFNQPFFYKKIIRHVFWFFFIYINTSVHFKHVFFTNLASQLINCIF